MPTPEEIFNNELGPDVCTINTNTRIIDVPSSIYPLGVESDQCSKVVKFKMENIFDNYQELSFRINYKNAEGVYDMYLIKDVTESDGNLEFSWTIGRNAVSVKGIVQFVVCVVKTDEVGNIVYEWNSAIASGTSLPGLELSEIDETLKYDIVTQLKNVFQTDVTFKASLSQFLAEVKQEVSDMVSVKTTKCVVSFDYPNENNSVINGLGKKDVRRSLQHGDSVWSDFDYVDLYYSYFGYTEVRRVVPREGATYNLRSMNIPNDTKSTGISFGEICVTFDGIWLNIVSAIKMSWDGKADSNVSIVEAGDNLEAGYIYKAVCYKEYKEEM